MNIPRVIGLSTDPRELGRHIYHKNHEIILPKNMRLFFQKIKENFGYKTERLPTMGRYATPVALAPADIFKSPDMVVVLLAFLKV